MCPSCSRSSASVRAGAPAAPRFASPASRRRFADFQLRFFALPPRPRGRLGGGILRGLARSVRGTDAAYRTRKLMGISFGSPGRRSIGAGREEVASTWRVETRRAHSHMSPSAMRLDTPQRCVRPERRRPSMPVKAPRSLSRPRHGTAVCARFRPLSPVQPPGVSARPASSTARVGTRSFSLRSDCSFRWCHGSEKDGALALPHPAIEHRACQRPPPAPSRNLPRSARWPGRLRPVPGHRFVESPRERCRTASPRPSSVSWNMGNVFWICSAVPPRQ